VLGPGGTRPAGDGAEHGSADDVRDVDGPRPSSGATSPCSTTGSTSVRADTARRLQSVLHDETVGTPQALTERGRRRRDVHDRLAALRAAEHGLAFGRLDTETGERRYIGRLGLLDEEREYEPLLMDWRAPAAQPFYTPPRRRPRACAAAGTCARGAARSWPSTTRCSTSTTPPRPAAAPG
jgi:hypothetical protein